MATARKIIDQAARKIHILGRGQVMDADEYQDALQVLNTMVDSLSTSIGLIFNNTREIFDLSGKESYIIGAGGDFDTVAPMFIQSAYIRIGTVDYLLKQINAEDYAAIGFKSISGIPELFYYEKNTPNARIFIYPVGTTYKITLYSLKPFSNFSSLSYDYDFPKGVEEMLVYNLAVRLASEYEKEASPTVKMMANQTLANVQTYNKRNNYPTSKLDIATTASMTGNIYSGWYTR